MPKIVDSERYRKELLHQCFDLLAEKGYANVTTRQLAQFLNISTGALYHYFPSKKALFEQLVEEMSQQDVQMLQAVAAGKTLPQRIRRLGELLVEREDYFVKQAALFVDFYRHTDIAETLSNPVFQRIDQQYQQVMMAVLGLSEPKVARFVWTLINGVLIEQVDGAAGLSFTEQIDLLTDMLIAYFEKHAT
jgi:AcrR family transcriptional regulator